MALVISVINMKGGVGKTTLAVNLAYGLAKYHSKRVLLVDVDPQFNATQYLVPISDYIDFVKNPENCTTKDIFIERPSQNVTTVKKEVDKVRKVVPTADNCVYSVYKNGTGFLDLIPSRLELMEADNLQRGNENKLKRFLDKIKEKYDYVIIDCPPTLSIFTSSAYLASDAYLITIKPDYLSSMGISLLRKALHDYEEVYGVSKRPLGVIFTMVTGHTKLAQRVMGQVKTVLSKEMKIYTSLMSHTTKIAETVGQKTIFDIEDGRYAKEMKDITQEFLNDVERGEEK